MMMVLFPLPGATYTQYWTYASPMFTWTHVYMDQHDDSPSTQVTPKCTTFQFESYRREGEGCLAQDTAVVEHFEKRQLESS
jgi:hypothetical protein